MTISSEVDSLAITIPTEAGMDLTIVHGEEEGTKKYDFIDDEGFLHTSVELISEENHHRPEFQVHASEEDLEDPIKKQVVKQCAQIALGLAAIDTRGSIFGGLEYDDSRSALPVNEVFPGAHQNQTHHYVGQAAIRSAIPEGFLSDAA
jgi:hypothetical protein